MGGSAKLVVMSGLGQAEFAIHGGSHFGGVIRVLAVVLPPANRAELERIRQRKCSCAAAGATKRSFSHACFADVKAPRVVYKRSAPGLIRASDQDRSGNGVFKNAAAGNRSLRDENLEPHVPLSALTGSKRHHICIHVAPFLAKRVGEVELVLDGDDVPGAPGR